MKWENNAEERRTKKNRLINGKNQSKSKQRVPFVIQKIGRGKTSEIEEITRMCIDVFFNEQDEQNVNVDENGKKKTAPWKALQLGTCVTATGRRGLPSRIRDAELIERQPICETFNRETSLRGMHSNKTNW